MGRIVTILALTICFFSYSFAAQADNVLGNWLIQHDFPTDETGVIIKGEAAYPITLNIDKINNSLHISFIDQAGVLRDASHILYFNDKREIIFTLNDKPAPYHHSFSRIFHLIANPDGTIKGSTSNGYSILNWSGNKILK